MKLLLPNCKVCCCCLIAIAFILKTDDTSAQNMLDPATQLKFVNPLPIPPVLDGRNGGSTFTVSISQFYQDLGLRTPGAGAPMLTKVWGYNNTYPGPTVLAKKDKPLHFFWSNNLYDPSSFDPLPHLLPIDKSITTAISNEADWQTYGIPVVTHLHGGHTEAASDGSPLSWFTPFFATKGPEFTKGETEPYTYNNDQDAATIWYHDHALGITRLNVYAGLAGFYLLTDDREQQLQSEHKLPASEYDLGLAIQDRMFTAEGELFYPAHIEGQSSPSIIPEFFGDFILVNGKAWPVLEVEPRQYRFRMLNGSDSRFYNLFLSSDQTFWQIGSDQGLLTSPVEMSQMLLGPGERKEVIIDFSNPALWGQTIILRNNAHSPYPKGKAADPNTAGQIMAFRVNRPLNTNIPLSVLPPTYRQSIAPLVQSGPTRRLLLFETFDEYGRIKPMLGTIDGGAKDFDDDVTENIKLNDTEVWEIYNTTEDAHPIHLHLVKFQAISTQKFNGTQNPATGVLTDIRLPGRPQLNNLDEAGWKDTEVILPGEVTRLIAKFDLQGRYEWHCHILSHEDHDMMRPFEVSASEETTLAQAVIIKNIITKDHLSVSPNPASSKTGIKFQISKATRVSIKIFNMEGRQVSTVFEGEKAAGNYNVLFNAAFLQPGMYICRMQVSNEILQSKFIVTR